MTYIELCGCNQKLKRSSGNCTFARHCWELKTCFTFFFRSWQFPLIGSNPVTSRLLTFSPLEAEDWFKPYQVHSLFPTKYVKIPPKEKKQD